MALKAEVPSRRTSAASSSADDALLGIADSRWHVVSGEAQPAPPVQSAFIGSGAYCVGLVAGPEDFAYSPATVRVTRYDAPIESAQMTGTAQFVTIRSRLYGLSNVAAAIVFPDDLSPGFPKTDLLDDQVRRVVGGQCVDFMTGTNAAFELWPSREELYDRLGRRTGPYASARAKDALLAHWRTEGRIGAAWLCERLRTETDVERQTDAEEALISIGPEAVSAIIASLAAAPSELQAEALLNALRWIGVPETNSVVARRVLRVMAIHKSPDVRLAAIKAASALPCDHAQRSWREFLREEDDAEVREEIEERLRESVD